MSQQVYVPVTPSDATTYKPGLTVLYVTASGNVAILGQGDAAPVTIPNVAAGILRLPYPISRVLASGTTATIVGGAATG